MILAKFFSCHQIRVVIDGIEISLDCVKKARELVKSHELENLINIHQADFLTFNPTLTSYDIVYTSAAVNDIFNLKLLHTSICWKAKWCLVSKPLTKTFLDLNLLDNEDIKVFVREIFLAGSNEKRPIMMIDMNIFNDEMKQIILREGRDKLVSEFSREINGINSDRIYNIWWRSGQKKDLKIEIGDIIPSDADYRRKWNWIAYNTNNESYFSKLVSRVVDMNLRKEIKVHFLEQYQQTHRIDVAIFKNFD